MLEQDKWLFFDRGGLTETPGIRKRATENYLKESLERRFPEDEFVWVHVYENVTGRFRHRANLLERFFGEGIGIQGLPDYIEVSVGHRTGEFIEKLIVWSPVAWNDRFAGTAGGGTGIGGSSYLTRPKNTQRGWTVPFAVMNGFTAATMDAGNIDGFHDHVLEKSTGRFSTELYENWRVRSTHNMTRFGKAIAEILHDRPVQYSYMNGGSGGGRQSLMEVQNYPEDYDGVWASCPAINWNDFLLGGFWPIAVMNECRHFLPAEKNQFFIDKVRASAGGEEEYFRRQMPVCFDANECVGMRSPGGRITAEDAHVMNEIWKGPHRHNGDRLWYGYYPGVKNWQKVIPIGTYYYPLLTRNKVKEFILGTYHGRWITGNPKQTFEGITIGELEKLYDTGRKKFGNADGNRADIDAFAAHGGKLLLDHGMDDPLIPTEGTISYYKELQKHFGEEKLQEFVRMYITPGDNHGNCWGNGPGITECDGMKALMDWRERGINPGKIRKVRVDKKTGLVVEESEQEAWREKGRKE